MNLHTFIKQIKYAFYQIACVLNSIEISLFWLAISDFSEVMAGTIIFFLK